MSLFFQILDWIFFTILAVCVTYLFFYAIASKFYKSPQFPKTQNRNRIAVIFPAYKEDNVIANSISSFLNQDYPKEYFDIIVVSDQMKEETNNVLKSMPIVVLEANYMNSSKAKALILAADFIRDKNYDAVIIMDADNTTIPTFLQEMNEAFDAGEFALQACRVGKKTSSQIAILDGVGEEINNGIFRSGHNAVHLSAALAGSGMLFESKWFIDSVVKLHSAGEDKELEQLLLKENIHIRFLDYLPVFDEKTAKLQNYENQRKRWIAVQYGTLISALSYLPTALLRGNINYCNKILQWMLPPRLIQLFLLFLCTIIVLVFDMNIAWKWIALCFIQLSVFILPLPRKFFTLELLNAIIIQLPILIFANLRNIFKLKGAHKNFIHTKHGDQ